ncbi:MAG: peptidoglycan-binding protein [Actinomycetota bacterium]|nr:peptidoglycan-binding protein [Actinomycetota bacterium]
MPRLIRPGDRGPQVRDVQQRLARLVEPALAVDGWFGPLTVQAVRRFQRRRGLEADGVVGAETWRELVEAGFSLGDRLLWRSRRMMRGDDVRSLQARLNELGFDAGPQDGLFGPLTHGAVEEFQRNAGLEVDAVVGPATVEALRRLWRAHQSSGLGIRAREREWLRRVAGRGLPGTRVLLDPRRGPPDAGHVGPSGTTEAEVTWQICTRLSARLAAGGAHVVLSRGPATGPSPSQRARLANEQGVDLVLSVATNALATPSARGSSTYYFGSANFVSEAGYRLAQLVQEAVVADGWVPDCRTHPVTWTILRETRMPAVVVEPGFITSPSDLRRLADPTGQEHLAAALAAAVTRFFTLDTVDLTSPPVAVPAGD